MNEYEDKLKSLETLTSAAISKIDRLLDSNSVYIRLTFLLKICMIGYL